MKVRSRKPRGQRLFKSVLHKMEFGLHKGTKVKRPFNIQPIENGWWFCLEKGQWESEYNGKGNMTSCYYSMTHDGFKDVYSLKAVKRLIYKWNVPKGTVFSVTLPFMGYEFFITK